MSNIVQGQTTTFKVNLLSGVENFAVGTPYTYNIALYTGNAVLNNATTAYTPSNEVIGGGYTAGGKALTISQAPVGDVISNTAYISFAPVTWTGATFTARCALIYNSTTGASIAVLDFGSDKNTTAANTFTVTFPTPTATTAIIRTS
jgi:hypothetical protein